ncbi:heavy-metal-associated domain-containing protein [Maribacter sp. 2307UL18-2]|uniref:heavy-metal-associated domain-containing protein n=1 Tax=Maribacter sp. 2307UL18-2 TaxID=3386274 RepID=UPI0039BC2DF1
MKYTYNITGMTCTNCVATVTSALSKIDAIRQVNVDLEKAEVKISTISPISIETLNNQLSDKYVLSEKGKYDQGVVSSNSVERSKLQQLKPLLLIFAYLFTAAFLLNYKDWNTMEAMLDFMGLFYIVFSFFKLLDLKGFPESFRMYDPLAKRLLVYGWVYPFIEVALGLMLLMRFQVTVALIATVVILGVTTIGVSQTLWDKKRIRCACLGTALKLPMTEATFIENAIMLVMACSMLFTRL